MTTPVCPSYAGHRFPAEIISHAVWLYFRFPLSLRMVEEMLAEGQGVILLETEGWDDLAGGVMVA
jgi:transposase-like protein